MKSPSSSSSPSSSRAVLVADSKSKRSYCCSYTLFPAACLICLGLFFAFSSFSQGNREKLTSWSVNTQNQNVDSLTQKMETDIVKDKCKNQCRPRGSEALPAGIVSSTSSFETRPLWDIPAVRKKHHQRRQVNEVNMTRNLFAMAVGIKQKDLVDKMVEKFVAANFTMMLFHYDGIVDDWKEFDWNDHVIHVAVLNQGKWWFAKRFLHPDMVEEYDYIFLWDEDLGVEEFHPDNYISIIKSEGLEISQPALDPQLSEVHHQITVRSKRTIVHRRTYKTGGCDLSSTAPPCTGWIEMMAPVFSRAAWRCVWYMIQNDLIHAWGLDMQLGYCAQGDRTKNVGVVDAEYIIHYNRPTLGGADKPNDSSQPQEQDHRLDVRRQSFRELDLFQKRWKKAVEEDPCWVDPFH
ncbi:hypothetical protein HN51_028322 [Arachis hypogaea]|uniref:Uncharacterized protein LOC107465900 n=2 Tax=Arachis TaxID=3817 RepID=A0A6P4C5T9_ARADU|nr:uncharacterized protein LOC107465900 [Arachis duranensis]XP_025619349.1 uncharacterized protein LOC112711031 [Arachis hypogaea]XP_057732288.1 uncharacterized protein LOC130947603 [Arachis stenosperma]QHO34815.1 hypothetical protein DS421_9g270230 [Arachis hypogaea]